MSSTCKDKEDGRGERQKTKEERRINCRTADSEKKGGRKRMIMKE